MTDHQNPTPATEDSPADIQQAQDRAGIAGEPQPTETTPTDTPPTTDDAADPQSNEALDQEPTSPPGYGGG